MRNADCSTKARISSEGHGLFIFRLRSRLVLGRELSRGEAISERGPSRGKRGRVDQTQRSRGDAMRREANALSCRRPAKGQRRIGHIAAAMSVGSLRLWIVLPLFGLMAGVGFTAALTTIGIPEEMPPKIPPALFVEVTTFPSFTVYGSLFSDPRI